jgi:hypothetical protein
MSKNMSENVYYSARTRNLPEVFIDYDSNTFRIQGRCIMEDVHTFFVDLIDRLTPMNDIKIIIDLEYLNSSSLRHLIFLLASDLAITEIEWQYQEEDFDVEEKGTDVKHVVLQRKPNRKFTIIEKPM